MAQLLNNIPTNLTEYPNSFKRQGAFPLEAYSVFYGEDEAKTYASSSSIAYVGQPLAIVTINENDNTVVDKVTLYIIANSTGTLQEVGKITSGDGGSITLVDGTLSIVGFSDASINTFPKKQENGTIGWVNLDSEISDLIKDDTSTTGSDVRIVAQDIARDYWNDAINEINQNIEALDTKIEETHGTVQDMGSIDGGNRYAIEYINDNLNIRSDNTLNLVITTGANNIKETTTIYDYIEGIDTINVINRTDGGMQGVYVSKTPATLNGTVSYPYHWKGTTSIHYLKLDKDSPNDINTVVSGIVDVSAPITECSENNDGTYTYGETTNITTNLPTGYVGSHLVSFEKCTTGESDEGGGFNYLKATVLGDFDNNNYNGTVFYFVEPKFKSRAQNGSGVSAIPSDAVVYPIALDLIDKNAIWSPTYCHNYQHKFVLFATKTEDSEYLDKIYLINAGTRVDMHTTEPAPVVANKFKFGGSNYILNTTDKQAIKVIVQNDSDIVETFDLIDNLKGHGKLACNVPILAYPAKNTGKFFGVSPEASWVSEEDLGAFSHYYTQKLGYVPDDQQYQIYRVNPVGDYQIIKIENQGIAYLDSGDLMVVPDALFHGVKRNIHPELPELASDSVPEEEIIQYMTISSWIQDTTLENLETRKANKDWETGRIRHFYRTLRVKRNLDAVVTDEDGTQHGGVANWSAFHEIITSENLTQLVDDQITATIQDDNSVIATKTYVNKQMVSNGMVYKVKSLVKTANDIITEEGKYYWIKQFSVDQDLSGLYFDATSYSNGIADITFSELEFVCASGASFLGYRYRQAISADWTYVAGNIEPGAIIALGPGAIVQTIPAQMI